MNFSQARSLFLELTKDYFGDSATVIFANQSRTPKPENKLVTILAGTPKRASYAPQSLYKDELTAFYPANIEFTVDLFTHGKEVYTNGILLGTEDSSLDEMFGFKDFLESEYVVDWCYMNDVAIEFKSDVQSLTGIVNDTTYEFRSRLIATVYFTHLASGRRQTKSD